MATVDDDQIRLTQDVMAHYERTGVSRRQFLRMLAAAGTGISMSGLLAACGAPAAPATTTEEAPAEAAATTAPAEAAATTAPAEAAATTAPAASGGGSGVLVFASTQDISNLDPHTGRDYSIASTQKAVYDTLLRYQGNPPELENLLATDTRQRGCDRMDL